MKSSASWVVPLLAASLAGPVLAQGSSASDGWQFEAAVFGWFPSIDGTTSFPTGASGPSISVGADQLIDSLKFAFMGTFEARRGRWGLLSDLVYTDVGDARTLTPSLNIGGQAVAVNADLSLDIKSWIWTLAGTYKLETPPGYELSLVAGARYLDMQQTLGWRVATNIPQLPGLAGSARVEESYWDGIVGVNGRVELGADRRWYVPYYADVGAGQTKLTWAVVAGLGYRFDWGSLIATWRHLDYDFKSDDLVQSLRFNGPTVGLAIRW